LKFIHSIGHLPSTLHFGNKALGLKKLSVQKFPVPLTLAIPAEVRELAEKQPEATDSQLLRELKHVSRDRLRYAVRSSGELEDSAHHSFAGQFLTELNVQGAEALLEAIRNVWNSVSSLQEGPYHHINGQTGHPQGMGVIIQEMVDVRWSGVAFSINPVTGRNETVIEGVPGTGEKLVQEGITPQRWIFHQGTWEPYDTSASPPVNVLQDLVSGMTRLRKVFGGEVDVEWGWDGTRLWYLQCRRVTISKYPTIYANHISREVLPGMIKPLVWSVNIPVVNSAWIRLLSGMLGKLRIQPEQLSRSFYYRAYFNMGTLGTLFQMMGLPRDSLESLMGRKDPSGKSSFRPGLKTLRYLPRMIYFLLAHINLGKQFRRKIKELNHQTDQLQEELSAGRHDQFANLFQRLSVLSREAAYWNIMIPLTMQITNRILQQKMARRGLDFNALEFTRDFPALNDYDPKLHIERLRREWKEFPEDEREAISSLAELDQLEGSHPMKRIREGLDKLIREFGHFSESGNDFSYQPWRENPEFLFDLIRNNSGSERSPTREEATPELREKIPGRAYRRAGSYRLYREMISSTYTRAYGLFRALFMATGEHMTRMGTLGEPEDVFFLTLEEHNRLLRGISSGEIAKVREQIDRIKKEMESFRDLSLPSVIYGETPPPVARADEKILQGIPVSPGIFEGELVVVKGYQDFNKQVEGRILVIPFSDVGWTPILSRAGAIVSESGGMLSHASIVARELSIPAIASIDHACHLKDGARVQVDGYNGMLFLMK
jgi:pyruvate,water dikinase